MFAPRPAASHALLVDQGEGVWRAWRVIMRACGGGRAIVGGGGSRLGPAHPVLNEHWPGGRYHAVLNVDDVVAACLSPALPTPCTHTHPRTRARAHAPSLPACPSSRRAPVTVGC